MYVYIFIKVIDLLLLYSFY